MKIGDYTSMCSSYFMPCRQSPSHLWVFEKGGRTFDLTCSTANRIVGTASTISYVSCVTISAVTLIDTDPGYRIGDTLYQIFLKPDATIDEVVKLIHRGIIHLTLEPA